MYDKYSGRSRRFAFLTMKTVEDANAAIEKLNGTVRRKSNKNYYIANFSELRFGY